MLQAAICRWVKFTCDHPVLGRVRAWLLFSTWPLPYFAGGLSLTDGDTGSHVCSSSCCKAAALGITRKVQRARMRESVTILFVSSKRKLTPFRREHSIRSQDGVRKMGRKTSELTKTFSRTSTSEEHDESLEGRLGVEEKLRYPSTSYV